MRKIKIMKNIRFIFNLITLAVLAWGVLQVKSFLDTNFVDNDTQIKTQLNNFLNGKTPLKN